MGTDRELLELAAKAVGIRLTWGEKFKIGDDEVDCTDMPYAVSDSPDESPAYWNPLTDDGDALRLAVRLNAIRGFVYPDEVSWSPADGPFIEPVINDDPYAAVRRCIVRAAAEIGKAMS